MNWRCGSMFGWAMKEDKVDSVFIISHLWILSVITKAAQRKEEGVFIVLTSVVCHEIELCLCCLWNVGYAISLLWEKGHWDLKQQNQKEVSLCHYHVTVLCLQNTGFSSHAKWEEIRIARSWLFFDKWSTSTFYPFELP